MDDYEFLTCAYDTFYNNPEGCVDEFDDYYGGSYAPSDYSTKIDIAYIVKDCLREPKSTSDAHKYYKNLSNRVLNRVIDYGRGDLDMYYWAKYLMEYYFDIDGY